MTNPMGNWVQRGPGRSTANAILCAVAALSGAGVLAIAFALGLEPERSAGDQPWLDLAGLIVMGSGLAAVVLGMRAWVREHAHTAAVVGAIAAGAVLAALAAHQLLTGLGTFA